MGVGTGCVRTYHPISTGWTSSLLPPLTLDTYLPVSLVLCSVQKNRNIMFNFCGIDTLVATCRNAPFEITHWKDFFLAAAGPSGATALAVSEPVSPVASALSAEEE